MNNAKCDSVKIVSHGSSRSSDKVCGGVSVGAATAAATASTGAATGCHTSHVLADPDSSLDSVWGTSGDAAAAAEQPDQHNVYKLNGVIGYTLNQNNAGILVDTGATSHILSNKELFTEFDASFDPAEHYLELADGNRYNDLAKGRGKAIIYLNDIHGDSRPVTLRDALYVPSYPKDILSVTKATMMTI